MPGREKKTLRIGVDTGGTFTDFISFDGDRVRIHKVPSTPDAPERAILQGLDETSRGSRRRSGYHPWLHSGDECPAHAPWRKDRSRDDGRF